MLTLVKSIITNDRLLNYVAEDHQKEIIEHESTITGQYPNCAELFRYYHEISYTEQPFQHHFSGYGLITIRTMPNKQFLLERECEYPDYLRKQHNFATWYNTYDEARKAALEQIDYMEDWLTSKWYLQQPITFCDIDTWNDHKQYNKKVYSDEIKVIRCVGDHNKYKFNIDLDVKENQQTEYFRVIIK